MLTIFDALGVERGRDSLGTWGRPTRPRPPCGGRTGVSTGPCPAGTSGSTCTGPPINATRDGNGWPPKDVTAGSDRWVLMAIVVTQQNRNVCSLVYFNHHFVAPIRCMIVKLQCMLLMSFFTVESFGGLPPDNECVPLWYSFLIRPIFFRAGGPFPLGAPGPRSPLPHTYTDFSRLPKEFNWASVNGTSYGHRGPSSSSDFLCYIHFPPTHCCSYRTFADYWGGGMVTPPFPKSETPISPPGLAVA